MTDRGNHPAGAGGDDEAVTGPGIVRQGASTRGPLPWEPEDAGVADAAVDRGIRKTVNALKAIRVSRDITLAQVAASMGVDKSVVSKLENAGADHRLSTLIRYGRAVGAAVEVRPTDLMAGDAAQRMSLGVRDRAWLDEIGIGNREELATAWAASLSPESRSFHTLEAPVGLDGHSVVRVRLGEVSMGANGPHMGICGRTGMGKSVALQTLLTGWAARHSPDRMQFLLATGTWGTFPDIAKFPHAAALMGPDVHVLTRRGQDDAREWFVAAITAELDRRGKILADMDLRDFGEYRMLAQQEDLGPAPELVVAIDDYWLINGDDSVLDALVRIGRLGRSLGVHLVLSNDGLVCDKRFERLLQLLYPILFVSPSEIDAHRLGIDQAGAAVPGTGYLARLPARSGVRTPVSVFDTRETATGLRTMIASMPRSEYRLAINAS